MNSIEIQKKQASREWKKLENNTKPIVYIGMGSCGIASGAEQSWSGVRQFIRKEAPDVQMIKVGCIGPCYLEPLLDLKLPGEERMCFNNVDEDRAIAILRDYLITKTRKIKPLGVFDGPGTNSNSHRKFWEQAMLKGQERIVLKNCGIINPESMEHYLAREGFDGLVNALKAGPAKVLKEIELSGLRGRGGAGFPTYIKWKLCREAKGNTKYLICNADEGDPGAFMNRSLIEGDPFALLEGMLIAAYAIGAERGYIYIRAEYPLAIKRLNIAISQMKAAGLIGNRILGTGFSFQLKMKEGAGAFVCGEETALIASIEGKRGMPKNRPPFPATSGLNGKPTNINNVETLATIPSILRNGGKWYAGYGNENSRGTKTFALVGKVRRTGLIEVPMGISLREIIFDIGGGTQKKFKAVQTGGPSGGCLSEKHLDLKVDYKSLAEAGSIMGSGGLIIMDEHTCMVDVAKYFLKFTSNESCGKCAPCRIGTAKMVEILEKITGGTANLHDIEILEGLAHTVKNGSLCGLGQTAPNPVLTTLEYFRDEYVSHIVDKRCPAAVCRELVEYSVIKDKCTGCQRCVAVCPTGAITGPRSEPHNLDADKCIKCRACYEICRYDAIAGDAIIIQ